MPTKASFTCPIDHVCVSSSPYPCEKQPGTYDCEETCSQNCPDLPSKPGQAAFSVVCSGQNTFLLCSNEGHSLNLTCPEGEVCTVKSGCAPSNTNVPVCSESDNSLPSTVPGTSSSSTETPRTDAITESTTPQTTTSQIPLTPDQICAGKPNQAKYPLSPPDPFCQKYVFFLRIRNVYIFQIFV